MANKYIESLKRVDPTTAFIEYIQEVKPYHCKVLEVLVEFVWTEQICTKVTERWRWDNEGLRPWSPGQVPVLPVYDCGYGIIWDAPDAYINRMFYIKGVTTGINGKWVVAGNIASYFPSYGIIIVGRNLGGGNGMYKVASVVNVGANTEITIESALTPSEIADGFLPEITVSATPHGELVVFDPTFDFIIDSDPSTYTFTIAGNKTYKYFEGTTIIVQNTYHSINNGKYFVASVTLDGTNTKIVVKDKFRGVKPTGYIYNGRMRLARPGYDEPIYCRLAKADSLFTSAYVGETIHFNFGLSKFDNIGITVVEDNPVDSPRLASSSVSAITLLPTGIDGQLFDLGGLDENYETATHLNCRTLD